MMKLGTWIRRLRNAAGMSRADFLTATGIDSQTLTAWERNTVMPTGDQAVRLCRTLRISPRDLLEPHSHTEVGLIRRHQSETIYAPADRERGGAG